MSKPYKQVKVYLEGDQNIIIQDYECPLHPDVLEFWIFDGEVSNRVCLKTDEAIFIAEEIISFANRMKDENR